jgi:hypothetical protein
MESSGSSYKELAPFNIINHIQNNYNPFTHVTLILHHYSSLFLSKTSGLAFHLLVEVLAGDGLHSDSDGTNEGSLGQSMNAKKTRQNFKEMNK